MSKILDIEDEEAIVIWKRLSELSGFEVEIETQGDKALWQLFTRF